MQAELYGNAVNLQRRVMDELLQHLFSAYNTFLSDRLEGPRFPLVQLLSIVSAISRGSSVALRDKLVQF